MTERRYTRGQLLRRAGLGAGVAVGGPLLRSGDAWAHGGLKVGVLAPSGSHYPHMGDNLLAGLELGLDRNGAASSLAVRHVEGGYAGAHEHAHELLEGGAEVVVAGVTAPVAQQLEPLFRERGRKLVVANVGSHVVRPEQRSRHVLYNSLLDWQAAFAMGVWARHHAAGHAVVLTSSADAGYDSLYAFRRGFGGSVQTLVDGEPLGELQALRAPSVAFVAASGARAASIIRSYRSSGFRAPLLASAFAVEDYVLPQIGGAARGIRSCASWATAVRDKEFVAAFRRRTGRKPDAFAVLGYETALLLRHRGHVDGLRGRLTVDAATNTVVGPLFLRQVRMGRNVVTGRAAAVRAFPAALRPIADETTSGYLNEYLCA